MKFPGLEHSTKNYFAPKTKKATLLDSIKIEMCSHYEKFLVNGSARTNRRDRATIHSIQSRMSFVHKIMSPLPISPSFSAKETCLREHFFKIRVRCFFVLRPSYLYVYREHDPVNGTRIFDTKKQKNANRYRLISSSGLKM